ncbi:MAG: pseudouridine synthase [Alphaproteobacteria bacterium]|nr:pseudouridine synthase [Alphaproteobacteria bacterium]
MKIRINKYLSEQGITSRREADEYIRDQLVLVNGSPACIGQLIDPAIDTVTIPEKKNSKVYYAYHKPAGIVTTAPQYKEIEITTHTTFPRKVFPIGRLDKNSTGLIIMTNDRTLTKKIIGANTHIEKEYIVTIQEQVTDTFLQFLEDGVYMHAQRYTEITKTCHATRIDAHSFSIILTEGKNRQIKRMVQAYGYTVTHIHRIRIGLLTLQYIPEGHFIRFKISDLFPTKK